MNTRSYKQPVTYWGAPLPNGLGGFSFDAPIILQTRWEESQQEFTLQNGDLTVSKAVVYVKQDVDLQGYLYLGETLELDPMIVSNAFKIMQFTKILSIDGLRTERRAFL